MINNRTTRPYKNSGAAGIQAKTAAHPGLPFDLSQKQSPIQPPNKSVRIVKPVLSEDDKLMLSVTMKYSATRSAMISMAMPM